MGAPQGCVTSGPLVSVIIPAHNAARTIRETLRSVREQTYGPLEIIVIDDGSSDETPRMVQHEQLLDPRIRYIRQANAGVAAARNRGLVEAKGSYVAPIDADDLWLPSKIALQVDMLTNGQPEMGLVYTWYSVIDDDGVTVRDYHPSQEGDVLGEILRKNFIGHASSPLMVTSVVREVGGYDETLRRRGAQGCEDLKLYVALAQQYKFGVVKEVLTGYRTTVAAMSSSGAQMLRSYDLVCDEWRNHPHFRELIDNSRPGFLIHFLVRSIEGRSYSDVFFLLHEIFRSKPRHIPNTLWLAARRGLLAALPITWRSWVNRQLSPSAESAFRYSDRG